MKKYFSRFGPRVVVKGRASESAELSDYYTFSPRFVRVSYSLMFNRSEEMSHSGSLYVDSV